MKGKEENIIEKKSEDRKKGQNENEFLSAEYADRRSPDEVRSDSVRYSSSNLLGRTPAVGALGAFQVVACGRNDIRRKHASGAEDPRNG